MILAVLMSNMEGMQADKIVVLVQEVSAPLWKFLW